MNNKFFPLRPDSNPTIYAYRILNAKDRKGLLNVGFTIMANKNPLIIYQTEGRRTKIE